MPFCSQCGTPTPDGAKFCPSCGTRLITADAAAPAPDPQSIPLQDAWQQTEPDSEPLDIPSWPMPAPPQAAPVQNTWQQPAPAPAPQAAPPQGVWQQPAPQAAPSQINWQQSPPQAAPPQGNRQQAAPVPQQANRNFSAVTVRYRCPNGHVFDGSEQQTVCPTCGAPLVKGGYIQLYRMGSPMGVAVGMGVYIDKVPHGHIANKQSIRISVPFGPHQVHVTHTTTRKCNDPVFTVTPEAPYVWCKAHFTKAGFAIAVDPASPEEMPDR